MQSYDLHRIVHSCMECERCPVYEYVDGDSCARSYAWSKPIAICILVA